MIISKYISLSFITKHEKNITIKFLQFIQDNVILAYLKKNQ
jgi:hypothetical protein